MWVEKAEAAPRPPATAASKREVETQRASLRAAEERSVAGADAHRATFRKGEKRGALEDASLREALQAEERAKMKAEKAEAALAANSRC